MSPNIVFTPPEYNVSLHDNAVWFFPDVTADLQPKLLGGNMDGESFMWRLPAIAASLEGLRRLYGPDLSFDGNAQEYLAQPWGFKPLAMDQLQQALGQRLWEALYGYQKEACHFMLSTPLHGCILALSPGLGKTLTSSAVALAMTKHDPRARVLIICPKGLRLNWQRELKQWHDLTATIVEGQDPIPAQGWVITNYDNAVARVTSYARKGWTSLIVDESLLVKNRKAARTAAIAQLSATAWKTWLLSGFPIGRYADDLYAQLKIIEPTKFRSYWRFVNQYCLTHETNWGTQILGTRSLVNLGVEFKDLIFTRNHAQVLPNLPKLIYQSYEYELTKKQAKAYQELTDDFITQLEADQVMSVTTKVALLIRLMQCVSNLANFGAQWPSESGKLNGLLELFEAKAFDMPAIIWTHWREGAQAIQAALKKNYPKLSVALVQGGINYTPLTDPVQKFKSGVIDVLIMSLSMGKYGHTLINARTIIYYDKTWKPDDILQSLARVDGRIGLAHRPVVITLKSPNTVDELVEKNLRGKLPAIAQLTNADMKDLLIGLGGRK